MFDVGFAEVLVLLVVAVVVFGPDRLPEFARQAGRLVRRLKLLAQSAQDDLRRELGPEYSDFKLTDLDPRVALRKHILDAADEADEVDNQPEPTTPPLQLPRGERPPYDVDAT